MSLHAQTERWCNQMDHSIQRLNYTAIRLLENTKQTGVNTAQNGTTHIYEELQEWQSPRHIIMLSRSNQKLKVIYKWGLSLITATMCPQSSQQQGNVAEASPRERDLT